MVSKRSYAEAIGAKISLILRGYSVVGVPPELMGIGPAFAIPAALRKSGLSIDDIDVFEINEVMLLSFQFVNNLLKI